MGYFFFWTPFLVLTDLDLTKQIFIKDFDHFTDRRKIEVGHEYLDTIMFMLAGEPWREMRSVVSPVFTSGKLKAMSGTIDRVGAELAAYVEKLAADCEDVNARDLASRFTTQSIATAGSCFVPFLGSCLSCVYIMLVELTRHGHDVKVNFCVQNLILCKKYGY